MSLVSVADVQARNAGGGLSDEALQDVIDAAEAWLTRRIGQLSGARTERFYPRRGNEPLYLRRTTDSVTVVNNGTTVTSGEGIGQYRLLYSGSVVELISADWLPSTSGIGIGPVTVAYTPNDEALVKEAIINLIRFNDAEGPFVSERIGDYSYQKAQAVGALDTARNAIVNSLMPKRPFRSERFIASSNS